MLACQVKIYQLAPNTELNHNFVLCSMPEDHTIKLGWIRGNHRDMEVQIHRTTRLGGQTKAVLLDKNLKVFSIQIPQIEAKNNSQNTNPRTTMHSSSTTKRGGKSLISLVRSRNVIRCWALILPLNFHYQTIHLLKSRNSSSNWKAFPKYALSLRKKSWMWNKRFCLVLKRNPKSNRKFLYV